MDLTINVTIRVRAWLTLFINAVGLLVKAKILNINTAIGSIERATAYAVKYRIGKSKWKSFGRLDLKKYIHPPFDN